MASLVKKLNNPWVVMSLSMISSISIFLITTLFYTYKDYYLVLGLASAIPAVVSFPISFVLIGFQRQIQQQKDEIEEKNTELTQVNEEIATQRDLLEGKNREIININQDLTESILYAQQIQEAMLPSKSLIQQHLPESFVLYKPRDIVSGDFYWFTAFNNDKGDTKQLLLAAVDCTGHGVPGALMSMMGNELLNEIVEVRGVTEPGEILQQLHLGVTKALKQRENDNRDGMEMALCSIDLENKRLHFAGAKNSLVIIGNGQLTEIKGDKRPIGTQLFADSEVFTTHTISLDAQPKRFYMFSDGFQDQFGGPMNKKFMANRFRKYLLEIAVQPMQAQKQLLEDKLTQWKNSQNEKPEPQTDDILVIGFQIDIDEVA
ncbi:hypothetical protein BKI52_44860 [marine bacterium AO1-C]|nr:hypothetical protein BKI52_44860 [marine bacterium AO1-C]